MHPRRLESRIMKALNRANREYALLEDGDRVLVALSGGKDSYGLLWGLQQLQAAAPYRFELVAYHLDQGQPGHDVRPIEEHIVATGVPYEVEYQDTYTRVVEKTEPGKIYCSLCSRFRRAILYKAATRHGCNKVALGHHADDVVETLLLNLFFSGQLKTMPPKLVSDDGRHQVIRPLMYVPEAEMAELAEHKAFPVVPCNLCGSLQTQRQAVKQMLGELSGKHPHIKTHILAAAGNIRASHLLDRSINPLYAPSSPVGAESSEPAPSADAADKSDSDDAQAGCGSVGVEQLVQIRSALGV